jgi:hypothetical protein
MSDGEFFGGAGKTVLDLAADQKRERERRSRLEDYTGAGATELRRAAHAERQSRKALRFGAAYGAEGMMVGYDPGLPGGGVTKYQVFKPEDIKAAVITPKQALKLNDEQRKQLNENGFVFVRTSVDTEAFIQAEKKGKTIQDAAREMYDAHNEMTRPARTITATYGRSPLPRPRELAAHMLTERIGSRLQWHTEGCKYDMGGNCCCPDAKGPLTKALKEKHAPISDDPNDIKARDEAIRAHIERGGTADSPVLRTDYYGTVRVTNNGELKNQVRAVQKKSPAIIEREERDKRLQGMREVFTQRLNDVLRPEAYVSRPNLKNGRFKVVFSRVSTSTQIGVIDSGMPTLEFDFPIVAVGGGISEESLFGDKLRELEDHVVPFVRAVEKVEKSQG